jgi:hypothetical protein
MDSQSIVSDSSLIDHMRELLFERVTNCPGIVNGKCLALGTSAMLSCHNGSNKRTLRYN